MTEEQTQKNWNEIPHLRVGEVPERIVNGPHKPMNLVVAKRCLMEVSEDAVADPETAMIDAVTNFRALCAFLGISFDRISEMAETHFSEEVNEICRRSTGRYVLGFKRDNSAGGKDRMAFDQTLGQAIQIQRRVGRDFLGCTFVHRSKGEMELNDNERVLVGIKPKIFDEPN